MNKKIILMLQCAIFGFYPYLSAPIIEWGKKEPAVLLQEKAQAVRDLSDKVEKIKIKQTDTLLMFAAEAEHSNNPRLKVDGKFMTQPEAKKYVDELLVKAVEEKTKALKDFEALHKEIQSKIGSGSTSSFVSSAPAGTFQFFIEPSLTAEVRFELVKAAKTTADALTKAYGDYLKTAGIKIKDVALLPYVEFSVKLADVLHPDLPESRFNALSDKRKAITQLETSLTGKAGDLLRDFYINLFVTSKLPDVVRLRTEIKNLPFNEAANSVESFAKTHRGAIINELYQVMYGEPFLYFELQIPEKEWEAISAKDVEIAFSKLPAARKAELKKTYDKWLSSRYLQDSCMQIAATVYDVLFQATRGAQTIVKAINDSKK